MARRCSYEAGSSKFQHPSSREAPNLKLQIYGAHRLKFGAWNFSGAWSLELGAFHLRLGLNWNRSITFRTRTRGREFRGEPAEEKINHRRRVKRQHLTHDQAADDGDAQRLAQ